MRRRKTATASNVMLLDIPKMIIDKYAGLAKDGKVFPVPSNALRNDSLRNIPTNLLLERDISNLPFGTSYVCHLV